MLHEKPDKLCSACSRKSTKVSPPTEVLCKVLIQHLLLFVQHKYENG